MGWGEKRWGESGLGRKEIFLSCRVKVGWGKKKVGRKWVGAKRGGAKVGQGEKRFF